MGLSGGGGDWFWGEHYLYGACKALPIVSAWSARTFLTRLVMYDFWLPASNTVRISKGNSGAAGLNTRDSEAQSC